MKTLTKLIAVLVVGFRIVGVVVRVISSGDDSEGVTGVIQPTATPLPPEPIAISVIAALPVEPWVRSAAETYNDESHFVGGSEVTVEVIPQEGLLALNKWARDEFDPIPTAWLAESRAWVDQANVAALD